MHAMPAEGLVTIPSSFAPKETMDRLEAEVKGKGLTVFAHIDHAAGATAVGMPLRPTDLLIFGNAKGGTPLMQAEQTVGIDLPLKILVWQDAAGQTWISYNDPHWLAKRHGIDDANAAAVSGLANILAHLAQAAASAK
jgi:uncharacterized protein (DUF302 family)